MRTDQYRNTEWRDRKTDKVLVRELNEYQTDPEGSENIAGQPENAELVNRLSSRLAKGWRGALPRD